VVVAPPDLTEFCEAQWPRLVGALSLYTGDADLAEELAQETVARVCRHWPRVRRMNEPAAWAHRVARNLAHSHFRRRQAGERALTRHGGADTVEHHDPSEAVAVNAALQNLPEREREAIVLRFYVGYSVRETAAVLRCPEGTVKTLTHRAIAHLRELGLVDDEAIPSEEVFDA
jgi:RNA polymerase sigma factor (sigma-70 family)